MPRGAEEYPEPTPDVWRNPEKTNTTGYQNANPFNLTGADEWQGRTGSSEAHGHNFVVFDDPAYGFRAGLLNHIGHSNRNIRLGRPNTLTTLFEESTPKEDANGNPIVTNLEWWEAGGPEAIAQQLGIGVDEEINLQDEELARKFAYAVANMETGTTRDPWGTAYEKGFDMVFGFRPDGRPRIDLNEYGWKGVGDRENVAADPGRRRVRAPTEGIAVQAGQ